MKKSAVAFSDARAALPLSGVGWPVAKGKGTDGGIGYRLTPLEDVGNECDVLVSRPFAGELRCEGANRHRHPFVGETEEPHIVRGERQRPLIGKATQVRGRNGSLANRLQDEHPLDVVGVMIEVELAGVAEQVEVPQGADRDGMGD